MAVISVKLKAIMDRELKEKVKESHYIFNEYVKIFEDFLILSYGNDYYYTDENGEEQYAKKEAVQEKLRAYLRDIHRIKDVDVVMKAISMLPKIVREKSSKAAGMLTKLYNKDSFAGTNNIKKIVDPIPEWVNYFNLKTEMFDSDDAKANADLWIESEAGQSAIKPIIEGAGRPSAFKIAYMSKKDWYASFIKDQNKYRKDLEDGLACMLQILEENGALPLVKIPEQLVNNHPIWVKLFLKTALENFASYLECDNATREEYNKLLKECKNCEVKVMEQFKEQDVKLRGFLKENYIQDSRSVYLTPRMCRGLKGILIEWKQKSSYQERLEILKDYQADQRKKRLIGDINFLKWLALDENQDMLDIECLDTLLDYHQALFRKETKRKCASFTTANPILSKRYIFYENETGTNYKKYKISMRDNYCVVKIPLLLKIDNIYREKEVEFMLAPSTQFKIISLLKGRVEFTNSKHIQGEHYEKVEESFSGKMGGMDIRIDTNGVGRLKNIYLSITIDVDEQCTKQFMSDSQKACFYFGTAYDGKKSKYSEQLQGKDLRALSIDLGLKQFAACTVASVHFEDSSDLQKHEIKRMFMLRLPEENCSQNTEFYRREAMMEISNIRTEIRYASFLKRLYKLNEQQQRNKLLKSALSYTNDREKINFYQYLIQEDNGAAKIEEEYNRVISLLNLKMKKFRSKDITKKQERLYRPGKSLWAINYLEELRKLIMSWNSLDYHINDSNKEMSIQDGVIAARLLNHINSIKDDRIKTGADMVVQAARGYVYIDGYWQKKYEPCNVIIFEDLSRYRFSSDRSKRENSKLMQWSHREIIKEVKRQAGLYGIAVYASTDAAYSSQFHYKTGTPGIRCDRLTKTDFDGSGKLSAYIFEHLPDCIKNVSEKLKVGSLIPSEIGSIFLTLDKDRRPIQLNADMNAAANLQNRFWNRHTHLFRISTVNSGGMLKLKSDFDNNSEENGINVGKREKGKFIYHYKTTKLMLTTASCHGHFKLVEKSENTEIPLVGEDKIYNLFNDSSGIFFERDEWIGYREYWETVRERLNQELVKMI